MHHTTRGSRHSGRVRAASCALVLATVATLAAACGSDAKESSDPTSGGTLTIAIPTAPTSLDPARNGPGPQNLVQSLAYEPLIRMKSDGSLEPGLATEWTYVGEGNMAFKLTIRTDAVFADGTPVTAEAVAATLTYYLDTPGTLSHYLTGVVGAKATDEDTVAISLEQPNPFLPVAFSQVVNWGDIISPAGLAAPDALGADMFGAGAYTLDPESTVEGDTYSFVKNDMYWNAEAITYDKVVVKVLPDANAALQALRSGQVQVDLNAPTSVVSEAESLGAEVAAGPGYVYTTFLMDRAGEIAAPLGDIRVRRALNLAIDREAIANALGDDFEPTAQIVPVGSVGYSEALDEAYEYDPDEARALLAEAGYADGFSFPMVTVDLYETGTVAQAVAEQWAEIGVKVEIKSDGFDFTQLITDLTSKEFPALQFDTDGDMFPNALQNFASPYSPLNPFVSTGDEVFAAFNELAAAPEEEQEPKSITLNEIVTDQAWFVPIASTPTYAFAEGIDDFGTVGPAGALDILDWKPES